MIEKSSNPPRKDPTMTIDPTILETKANRYEFASRGQADAVAEITSEATGLDFQAMTITHRGYGETPIGHTFIVREVVGRGMYRFGNYLTKSDVRGLAAGGHFQTPGLAGVR